MTSLRVSRLTWDFYLSFIPKDVLVNNENKLQKLENDCCTRNRYRVSGIEPRTFNSKTGDYTKRLSTLPMTIAY